MLVKNPCSPNTKSNIHYKRWIAYLSLVFILKCLYVNQNNIFKKVWKQITFLRIFFINITKYFLHYNKIIIIIKNLNK